MRHYLTTLKPISPSNQGLMMRLTCVTRQKQRREDLDDNTTSKSESVEDGCSLFCCLLQPLSVCAVNKRTLPTKSFIYHTEIHISRLSLAQHYGLAFYSLQNKKFSIMFIALHKAITINVIFSFFKIYIDIYKNLKILGPEQTTRGFRQTY